MERNRPHMSREDRLAQRTLDWYYARGGVNEIPVVTPQAVQPIEEIKAEIITPRQTITNVVRNGQNFIVFDPPIDFSKGGGIPF